MITFSRIKEISDDRGLSLQEVAENAKLGKNSIYKWKSQAPSIVSLQKVADVLDVSTEYLLGHSDNQFESDKPKEVDIEDQDIILTFEGQPISPEDLELMKRLIRGGRNT